MSEIETQPPGPPRPHHRRFVWILLSMGLLAALARSDLEQALELDHFDARTELDALPF
ncbi:MAG: hypothetical protein GYB65_18400 [Chloroflexi bacterium]|nr:hypothetical protein [Chloroflexota bacterium]